MQTVVALQSGSPGKACLSADGYVAPSAVETDGYLTMTRPKCGMQWGERSPKRAAAPALKKEASKEMVCIVCNGSYMTWCQEYQFWMMMKARGHNIGWD